MRERERERASVRKLCQTFGRLCEAGSLSHSQIAIQANRSFATFSQPSFILQPTLSSTHISQVYSIVVDGSTIILML